MEGCQHLPLSLVSKGKSNMLWYCHPNQNKYMMRMKVFLRWPHRHIGPNKPLHVTGNPCYFKPAHPNGQWQSTQSISKQLPACKRSRDHLVTHAWFTRHVSWMVVLGAVFAICIQSRNWFSLIDTYQVEVLATWILYECGCLCRSSLYRMISETCKQSQHHKGT